MTSYNPWPLGALPESWQRREPEEIRRLGYEWSDAREINQIFEENLASFSGSKFAVLTDSCSNALFLALKRREVIGEVEIPLRTYVSVANQILHAGGTPVFRDYAWSGVYELGSTGILDSAARFTGGMFAGDGYLQCLSFQIKKRLPIGRGGAILTNSEEDYLWLRRAVYDGRDLSSSYDSVDHVTFPGWHFYMTPEDAARGLLILNELGKEYPDTMTSDHYPPLNKWSPFSRFKVQVS